ncbi:MAG: hypothetical protein WBN77_04805 [Desulfobacterales bacterium]
MIVDNKELVIRGRFIKKVQLKSEWDVDIKEPEAFIKQIKNSKIKADIFTFMQRLPESRPKYNYQMIWDSRAAIPITTYDHWHKNQLHQNPRNKMRIAQKKGVIVKLCEFNDDLIEGITNIYNETPIRQNKRFPQYGIDFNATRKAHITYIDRAHFIGAYYNDEMIGFLKLVSTENYMRTMGILAKESHRDKAPMNLLVAKAVEICAKKGIPYFVYGKYNYGKGGSETFREFKHYLGFESIVLPRYYIPLNAWGSLIINLNLHLKLIDILPKKLLGVLLQMRNNWHMKKYSKLPRNNNC